MLKILLTSKHGLGWCCMWAGLKANARIHTAGFAAALGMSKSAVKEARRKYREGCYKCEKKEECKRHLL